MSGYSIENGILRLDESVEVRFDWPVREAIEVDGVIVVRTESPPGRINNRNVYGVLLDGNVVWRVQPVATVYEDSPFVSLIHQGENVVLGNWDGMEIVIDARTGKEVSRRYRR